MILKSGYDIDEKGFAWQYWNVFLSPLPIKTKAQALFGSIQVLYHCFGLYRPRPLLMHTHCTFPLSLIAWKVWCIIRCFGLYHIVLTPLWSCLWMDSCVEANNLWFSKNISEINFSCEYKFVKIEVFLFYFLFFVARKA